MDHSTPGPLFYPIFSTTVDWITASGKPGSAAWLMQSYGDSILDEERAAGRDVKPAARLGYDGWSGEGFFTGVSPQGHLVILSSQRAARGAMDVTRISSNVSRLDVQVTIFCGNNGPHLAQEAFLALDAMSSKGCKQQSYSLTQTRPIGETLNLNRRVSDQCGRLYDKASEAKIGPPCSLWRYELELKRKMAKGFAHALAGHPSPTALICTRVHKFFSSKEVVPAFAISNDDLAGQRSIAPAGTDTRAWLRKCVSVTIRREISKHGLRPILEDLHLDQLVQPLERSKGNADSPEATSHASDAFPVT